ncbi:MAG: hypothetical protein Q7O66_05345, partial [Dehalococcoidia bacterium]|nr:hypothetical protein [Dehalococcoidia bacterium]
MTRIDELTSKYPQIPRDLIIKWELWNKGVKDTEDLDKVSEFKQAVGTYQNKFDEVDLAELVAARPSRLKNGQMLRPGSFFMKSSSSAPVVISRKSPYEVREEAEGKFFLYEGEEKIDGEIFFPKPKPREGAEPV